MDRIKGIRQKTGQNTYAPLVPFGTDAILVDFLSGLDLEQQLKIGGNHTTSIIENNENQTTVTEKYYNQNGVANANVTYTVKTVIIQNNNTTTITISIYEGNQTTTVLRSKTITITDNATTSTVQEVLS